MLDTQRYLVLPTASPPSIGWLLRNTDGKARPIIYSMLKLIQLWFIAVAVCGGLPDELIGNADSTVQETEEKAISIDVQARIERHLGQDSELYVFSRVELPSLEGGKKYRVNLTLVNPYDTPIDFSSVTLDCGCAKLETKVNELPALGVASFVMHLDVPYNVTKSKNITTAKFSKLNTRKPVLELAVSYETNNVFSFADNQAFLEIPKNQDVKILKLPIVLIPPMSLEQLELKYTDNLRDLRIQLVNSGLR